MAMNVELREKPRVFEVFVGENSIGKVTSYVAQDDDASSESYEAILFTKDNDDEDIELGWYSTFRVAAQEVVLYEHGESKIDAVIKRKV